MVARRRYKRNRKPANKIAHQDYSVARMLSYVQENPSSPIPSQWKDLAAGAKASGIIETTEEGTTKITEEGERLLEFVRRRYPV